MNLGYIRVSRSSEKWQLVSSAELEQPVDMVQLVIQAPEFLGALEPDGGSTRAAVVAPGSSSGKVVVAIGEKGGIGLVVCPETGEEAELSTLVGDLLATGGRFWHKHYDFLAKPFEKAVGVSLDEWFKVRTGKGWSAESFRTGLDRGLSQGKFPVLVVTRGLGQPIQEMLGYLENMNFKVSVVGYSYCRCNGMEVVRPRVLGKEEKRTVMMGVRPHGEQSTPVVAFTTTRKQEEPGEEYPRFPTEGVSEKQAGILEHLVRLDDLGLRRQGFEYFLPGSKSKETSEGTIVVAVDPDRWPSPKEDEVIVIVNTSQDHLAGYLRLSPEEVDEFLGSLPRVQRKEHKGCLLFRVATVYEAGQLVNEMRALKEVAQSGV